MNPIDEFARLDGTPLVSPINLSIPPERPYTPQTRTYPSAVPAPAGHQGGVDPEHNFFPGAGSLNQFLPADGAMDASELIAGGNINPAPRALDPDGSGNTDGAPEPPKDSLGYAAFVKHMLKNRADVLPDRSSGYRPGNQKLIQRLADKYEDPDGRKFDPDVVEQLRGDYSRSEADQARLVRHKGGPVTDAETGAIQPGTPTDMTLLEGEHIMTRQAVEMFGVEFFDQLNAAAAQKLGQDAGPGPAVAPAAPAAPPGPAAPPPGGAGSPLDEFASMI